MSTTAPLLLRNAKTTEIASRKRSSFLDIVSFARLEHFLSLAFIFIFVEKEDGDSGVACRCRRSKAVGTILMVSCCDAAFSSKQSCLLVRFEIL